MTRPGDMGFDIVHMNLHKTFAVPHGGGGPGAGPVAVSPRLAEFLPGPMPVQGADGVWEWIDAGQVDRPRPRLVRQRPRARRVRTATSWPTAPTGCARSPRARCSTPTGCATACAARSTFPYDRPNMHEFVASATNLKASGVKAFDIAKGLLDEGFHAPTMYFPLIVAEALMIEPTETESLQTLEALAQAFERVAASGVEDAERLAHAPYKTPVGRVDEAKAARQLIATEDMRPTA